VQEEEYSQCSENPAMHSISLSLVSSAARPHLGQCFHA
jgi:hypothetical protein